MKLPVPDKDGLIRTVETITPDIATAYLNSNKGNRKLREGAVEAMACDMREGRWTQCLAPIAFYVDGDLADGQHRLWSIVESGCAQTFTVIRNVPREAGLNIDCGGAGPRTLADNAAIAGIDQGISNQLIAIARSIHFGDRQFGTFTNAQRLEWIAAHREAGDWVLRHAPTGRGIRNQPVLAAMARAYYHEEDKDRLHRFAEVLRTGHAFCEDESAAVSLRNYLLNQGAIPASLWRDTFLKAQNAISYFLRRKKLMVIKKVAEELYPLPKKFSAPAKSQRQRGSAKLRKAAVRPEARA